MIDRKNIKNLYALSPLQEGMLFHALKEPDSRAYFEQLEFGLEGALDTAAFAAAWQDVVDRHDALRTLFVVKQVPQPLQVVLNQWPIALEILDLTSLSAAQAQARIAAHKAADLEQGFAVMRTPPLRLALFRLAPDRHRVLWSFHHILLDGWSLAILQRDWEACYLARLQGRPARLPPAPAYAAYIRWLGRQNPGQAAAYWAGLLAGVTEPAPLPLRLDRRFATDAPPYAGGEHRHPLSAEAETALNALARQQGVTLNTVVQTLWGMILARLNGSHDAVFAATVAGRPVELPDAAQTVGLFINAIPVRVRFDDGLSFADLLDRMHRQAIAGQEFHYAPLAEILAAHPLRQTLAEHILVFENYPLATEQPEDPRLPRVAGDQALHEYTHYPFECQFLPGTPSALRFRYHRGLFADEAISALGGQFEALARRALAEPGAPAAALAHAGSPWTPPRRIVAAASFTAEPAIAAANDWLRQMAVPRRVELAPYNQCLRELADPDSRLNRADLGILLLRWTDALRDLAGSDPADADRRLAERFQATVEAVRQRPSAAPLLVALLPAASAPGDWETRWRQVLASCPGVTVLDLTHLAARYRLHGLLDAQADRLGHLPYSEAGCAALGAEVARAIVARARPPFKVIAVDCDNTLWSGVCGEAGPTGVVIGPDHAALQQFLIARQKEGVLIALASKNLPADVWAVFEQHPGMRLHREHLAAAAINWQPKSANLRALAAELQVGLDSFIFLDDNPAECAEVMTHAPDVLALTVPENLQRIQEWLSLVWAFDQPAVTAEDRDRTKMMQAERRRQAAQDAGTDLEDFLRGLGLVVRVGPMQLHQASRVAQLSQRTNQFNLSGQRRDEAAMIRLAREASVWAVEVEDRFGAYGLTGAVIALQESETLLIDSFLLSCRVLGRRVEDTLLCALARQAMRLGCRRIVAPLVPTARNEPIRRFLQTPPWREEEPQQFVCAVEQVAAAIPGVTLLDDVQFPPPPTAIPDAMPDAIPLATADDPGVQFRSSPLPMTQSLEHEAALRHGVQYLPLLAAAAGWPVSARRPPVRPDVFKPAGRPPAGEIEPRIAAIWSEVLGLAVVDAETPFSDLGGHSLHAVRIISRLERAFSREIGLGRLFEQPTIAAMARWLQDTRATRQPGGAIPPAPDAADYPLSHSQERIWLLCRLGGAATAYNQCAAYRLRGPLDLAALQAAAQQLITRHEILRTVFPMGANGPRQRILAHQTVDFRVEEAADVNLDVLCARLAMAGRQPFDLEAGPLLRLTLCQRAGDDHVLAVFMHHIVGDGWSFGLILHELTAAYRGETLGGASLRYRDYAVWTRSADFEAKLERHREYWRSRLTDPQGHVPEMARIPVDFAEPGPPTGQGAGLRRLMAADLPELERELAGLGVSLFPFLTAAVAVLIMRLGGLPTVRLGAPVAGRDRPELETMVGVCVNTLVLDGQIDETQSFATLLKAQQETLIGALEHQHYPFERLVADLDPPRDPSRHPLFDVLVVLQNTPRRDTDLPGVTATDLSIPLGVAAFDLVFEFAATDAGLVSELTYATDRYHPETADLLLERLATLMAAVRVNPDAALRDVPLMSAAEQARLAAFARGPARPIPETTIHGLFAAQVTRTPHALALLTASEDCDYETLAGRANALAERLIQDHGLRPGEIVAVLLERTAEWPIALLAILKAGGVYLPLEPNHPPARWRQLLADAQPRALMASATLVAALGDPAGWSGAWLEPTPAASAKAPPAVAVGPDDPAYLLYTSGSTGIPKGVLVSHRAFVNMILSQIQVFELTPADRVLQLASCAFDAALSELFMGWLSGAAVALADRAAVRDSAVLARFLSDRQVTLATFTPSWLRQLRDADLRPLQRVILAGEAVRGADVARLRRLGIVCYNAYGPTETAVCATLGRVEAELPDAAPAPIGRPLANLTVEVLDPHGRPVPIGVAGELVVSGVGVALGYWRRPDLTAERFQFTAPDGSTLAAFDHPVRSYRTGDRARWLPNGVLEYLGRSDDQIKRRGQRIEPGEVAARIAALDGVRQAAAVGETRQGEDLLIAYVCADPRREASLRAALADQLPASLLPDLWVFLDQLPLTSNGKLDKNRLPRPAVVAPSARLAPADAVEAALLGIWRELLGCSPGVDDNFFTIGGNSLNAMRGARLMIERLGLPCQAVQFFQTPTVRGLANALTHGAERASAWCATLHPLSPPSARTLIALPPAPGLGQVYAPLAAHLPGWSLQAFDFADLPVDELIERYARILLASAAPESFTLLGYSGGGRLALALAATLIARQRPPRAVILVDCWRWSTAAARDIRHEEEPFAAEGLGALATLYRQRLESWEPGSLMMTIPVHHVLAETPQPPPPGFSRDWRAVCAAGYTEYSAAGAHYDFLDARYLPANALLLRSILAGTAVDFSSPVNSRPVLSI